MNVFGRQSLITLDNLAPRTVPQLLDLRRCEAQFEEMKNEKPEVKIGQGKACPVCINANVAESPSPERAK